MTFISHLPKSHSISFLHRTTARLRPKTTIMRTSNVTSMSQNFNSKGQLEGHDVLAHELIEEEETLMRGAKVRKPLLIAESGSSSCRARGCQYVYITVVADSLKNTKNTTQN